MAAFIRGSAVIAVLSGAAVALAGPASADPLTGTYTRVIDGTPMASTATFTPCGPDCMHLQTGGSVAFDLHLQGGSTWTGSYALSSGSVCAVTLDSSTLREVDTCEGKPPLNLFLTQDF